MATGVDRNTLFWSSAGLVTAIIALAVPVVGSATATDIGFRVYVLLIMSVSWNLMAGAGLVSLGH